MSEKEYTEDELIQGCVKNIRKLQEAFYRRYATLAYKICLGYARDRSEAKDMMQEAFLKIYKKIKDYKKTGSLEGWVRRVIVNTALDFIRKHKKEMNWLEIKENDHQETEIDNHTTQSLNVNDLMEFISSLPHGARTVFHMFAIEGFQHKEIAEKLNISEGTSKSQYNRARELLKQRIIQDKPGNGSVF